MASVSCPELPGLLQGISSLAVFVSYLFWWNKRGTRFFFRAILGSPASLAH
jgi:hypothetical protein